MVAKVRKFVTSDVYTASALTLLLQIQPTYTVVLGRTIFEFPESDQLYKALNDFNAGSPINGIEYSQIVRRMRSEMLLRRNLESSGDRR
jgi:hypothetical protein